MVMKGHQSALKTDSRFGKKIALFLLAAAGLSLLWPVLPARADLSVQVDNGVLTAVLTEGEAVEITCLNGSITVNDQPPDNGLAVCSSIIGVVVTGSNDMDVIDLRQLGAADFPALSSVRVEAGAGNDILYASPFVDVLDGGPGDDTYVGTDKMDKADNSQGQDYYLEATLPLDAAAGASAVDPVSSPQQLEAPGLQNQIEAINFNTDAALTGIYQIPPDPIGAAGPAHVLSVVNSSIQWFTKSGALQNSQRLGSNGTTYMGSFFAPLVPVNRLYNPKAIYDQHAGRFLVVALERQDDELGDPVDSSRILLAVSDDSDPNGTWSYHAINSNITISGDPTWADSPGFSIDEEAVYISNNMFTYADINGNRFYRGTLLWIVAKQPFYSGGAASVTVHDPAASVTPPVAATTMQPAHIFGNPPAGVGTWLVRTGFAGGNQEFLSIIRVDDPLGTPSFSHAFVSMGDIEDPFTALPDAPQRGTAIKVATNDRRSLHAVWRNNSLWATFQILDVGGVDPGEVTSHWVRVDTNTLVAPTLADQGNARGEDIAAGTFTFFPSIAVDQCGNMGLGFAASAPTIYPGAYYSARYASDAPGTLQPSAALAAGRDYYNRAFNGTLNRWGDYSGIALDPTGEATFWVYNEYALTRGTVLLQYPGQDGRWGTRWGSFLSGIDFGDLPAAYSQSLNGNDGARHCMSSLTLGAAVDADPDGQESATAQGDNDDGVVATGNWSDGSGNLLVQVSGGNACLSAWLDYWDGTSFGANNAFTDPGEQIFDRQALAAGVTPLSFALPLGAASGSPGPEFFGRFRLVPDQDGDGDCTDQAAISVTGLESGGEVEDYRFSFDPTAVNVSAFQASPLPGDFRFLGSVWLLVGICCPFALYILWRLAVRRSQRS